MKQEDREQILSHGEVGGRNMAGWHSQKKVRKRVGGIIGERDREEETQKGSQAHTTTKQQTEGTECEIAATNKHGPMARGDSVVSVLVV